MKSLICFCIQRPVTALMIIAAIFMGGFISLGSMPLDKLPEIFLPYVTIETIYSGMSAPDIRSSVTIPLEDAVSPVKGLESIRSVSRDNVSLITLGFRWGTDPSNAAALVREAVDRAYPGLPHGAAKPSVVTGSLGDEPHTIVAVRSKTGSNSYAKIFAEYELKARLRRLDGTGTVILRGGETEEAKIIINPERMVSRGFNHDDFATLVASEIIDVPAGNIREGSREITVVSQGRPQSIAELSALVLPASAGPLQLRDIGVIVKETAPQKSLFLFQNEEQTALEIYRRPGADPIKLSRDIKNILAAVDNDFFSDIELFIVWDSSYAILDSIRSLIISAVIAAAAVACILAVFIRHFRSSFLAALALPVSAAASVILLKICGCSINTMSLAGLAMGIGLVSDVSVIVLYIFNRNLKPGEKPDPLILAELTASVSGSSFAGAVTTILVFLPIIFLPGPLGALFGDLSLTLIASVVTGWIYAQFFLPSLYLFFYKENKHHQSRSSFLEKIYRSFLSKTLHRPIPVMAGALIFSVIGFLLLFGRPAEFYMSDTVREVEVVMDFPPGTNFKTISNKGILFSEYLAEIKTISHFFARAGAENEDIFSGTDPDFRNERLIFRCFLEKGTVGDTVLKTIQNFNHIFDSDIKISAKYPDDRTGKLLGLSSSPSLIIKADFKDIDFRSEEMSKQVMASLGSLLSDIGLRPSGTRPEARLIPDREAVAFLGISSAKIASAVYTVTEGLIAGTMEVDGRPLDIRISGDARGYSHNMIETLPLFYNSGSSFSGPVFLGSLGKIERRETKAVLARQDRCDVMYMDLFAKPGKEKELRAMLNTKNEFSKIDESVFSKYQMTLVITLVLVIILLYLSMAALFESFRLPLIIMLSILFGFAGAGPMLFLTGSGLDSGSVLGLIVLFGLAVNNGIILYEAGEENAVKSFLPAAAVFKGALDRFRPVLISALTTVFGLIPLLLSPGASQRSMAAAMLGGLAVSTLLTIFILPPVFILVLNSRTAAHV